jgi:hypothetical protein
LRLGSEQAPEWLFGQMLHGASGFGTFTKIKDKIHDRTCKR